MTGVPRYLFRLTSPRSRVTHDERGFCSVRRTRWGTDRKLSEINQDTAKDMIKDHVLWNRRPGKDDFLISFTSSFFYAIQFAIHSINQDRRRQEERDEWFSGSSASEFNCKITVLDTTFFNDVTFHWTPDLLAKYKYGEHDRKKLAKICHAAEYLVENQLRLADKQSFKTVTLIELIERGMLKDALPHFDWSGLKLSAPMLWFRHIHFSHECWVTSQEVQYAWAVASCFGDDWQLPIMIWVVAAYARKGYDQTLIDAFRDTTHSPITSPLWKSKGSEGGPPSEVEELVEWLKIAKVAQLIRTTISTPSSGPDEGDSDDEGDSEDGGDSDDEGDCDGGDHVELKDKTGPCRVCVVL